jgi:hypothetical protein
MAKQKFRPTRLGGFSGAKAYIRYVEVLKKRRNAVGRTFCDAINIYRQSIIGWHIFLVKNIAPAKQVEIQLVFR